MFFELIQLITNYGVLVIIGAWALKYAFSFFERKTLKDEKTRDEFDSILVNQLKEFQHSILNYKNDLQELKKLILNQTNMSVNDFEIFCTSQNNMMLLQMQTFFFQIIEQNHISEKNLEITLKKVQNIIESVINKSIYNLQRLSFDKNSIEAVCKVQEEQKQALQEHMEQLFTAYIANDSPTKEIDTKRSVEELLKYISNILTTETYKIISL